MKRPIQINGLILMKVCFNKLFPIKQNKNEDLLLEKFNYISSHADIEKL
jgi:hypothetical protein